jgi:lipopolysaccharide export system ATP-binding protein
MSKLTATKIEKYYKKTKVLESISIEINGGETVSLLGPNGAGKTTLFYIICGLVETTGGKVELDGVDVTKLGLSKKAQMGIAYLPQESSIFKDLTVEDNIALACEIALKDESKVAKRVEELLDS